MINLMQRGYQPGSGMWSPDRMTFLLSIPKNASTYTLNLLRANNWDHASMVHVIQHSKAPVDTIVLLRDPVDRWISGFTTYCANYILGPDYTSKNLIRDYNELTERIIFDNLVFDDHTEPQSTFVDQLTGQFSKKFVLITGDRKKLIKDISNVTGQEIDDLAVDSNMSEDTQDNKIIADFIRGRIDNCLKEKIFNRYYKDYEILQSIKCP